ncbi:Hypothetical predicted protein [Cloeon dipterum]|uniref:C-type lectin domain-containing protein n=1 Tax=Cloeon dipterum TaxID=197152 RepID=A0A8S1CAZ6_9INSE|nr:Hypothetical predicted protein [Cloeon dipterum]
MMRSERIGYFLLVAHLAFCIIVAAGKTGKTKSSVRNARKGFIPRNYDVGGNNINSRIKSSNLAVSAMTGNRLLITLNRKRPQTRWHISNCCGAPSSTRNCNSSSLGGKVNYPDYESDSDQPPSAKKSSSAGNGEVSSTLEDATEPNTNTEVSPDDASVIDEESITTEGDPSATTVEDNAAANDESTTAASNSETTTTVSETKTDCPVQTCPPNPCEQNPALMMAAAAGMLPSNVGSMVQVCEKQYVFAQQTGNIADANKACCALGKTLASLETQVEMKCLADFAKANTTSTKYWVSGLDFGCQGNYKWCSPDLAFDSNEKLWLADQPVKSANTTCVAANLDPASLGLSNENCELKIGFICE